MSLVCAATKPWVIFWDTVLNELHFHRSSEVVDDTVIKRIYRVSNNSCKNVTMYIDIDVLFVSCYFMCAYR